MSSVAQETPVSDEMLLTSMIVFASRLARDAFLCLACSFYDKPATANWEYTLHITSNNTKQDFMWSGRFGLLHVHAAHTKNKLEQQGETKHQVRGLGRPRPVVPRGEDVPHPRPRGHPRRAGRAKQQREDAVPVLLREWGPPEPEHQPQQEEGPHQAVERRVGGIEQDGQRGGGRDQRRLQRQRSRQHGVPQQDHQVALPQLAQEEEGAGAVLATINEMQYKLYGSNFMIPSIFMSAGWPLPSMYKGQAILFDLDNK